MKCKFVIDSSLLTADDIGILNDEEKEISFLKVDSKNFLPAEIVLVLIELGQNIGYSAAYDIIKYALNKLMTLFKKRTQEDSKIKIDLAYGEKIYSITCNFDLTEEQKDKLIDAAAKKLLEEK